MRKQSFVLLIFSIMFSQINVYANNIDEDINIIYTEEYNAENELTKRAKNDLKSDKLNVYMTEDDSFMESDILSDYAYDEELDKYVPVDQELYMVTQYIDGDKIVTQHFFVNDESKIKKEKESNLKKVEKKYKEKKDNAISSPYISAYNSYGYEYQWGCYRNGIREATIYSCLDFKRNRTSHNLNGKIGSVWDIKNVVSTTKHKGAIMDQYTRIDVSSANQSLLDYGPKNNYNGNTHTVSISKAGPSYSYNFNSQNYNRKDYSNMGYKYARWAYLKPSFSMGANTLTTEPTVRVFNSVGKLYTKPSYSVSISGWNYHTGVVNIYTPDR